MAQRNEVLAAFARLGPGPSVSVDKHFTELAAKVEKYRAQIDQLAEKIAYKESERDRYRAQREELKAALDRLLGAAGSL